MFISRKHDFPSAMLIFGMVLAVCLVGVTSAHAQTFTVLHAFTGGDDGANPESGVTIDRGGNLYFTTAAGGYPGQGCGYFATCGTVGKLSHRGGGWTLATLFEFNGGDDGGSPSARVVFGPDGKLYGTTFAGGSQGYGVLFTLNPKASICPTVSCAWNETVLHGFGPRGSDGTNPNHGDEIFDSTGNIFGVAGYGGFYGGGQCGEPGCGADYQLTRSNGAWNESVIYSFQPNLFYFSSTGLTLGQAGNLYGTAAGGAYGRGVIYELSPTGGTWTATTLYQFPNPSDGGYPSTGLTPDAAGNFYGATSGNQSLGYPATVYELSPSGGSWTYQVLYTFQFNNQYWGGPAANLTLDAAGNIYGTAQNGGAFNRGTVFKLTHTDGGWVYASLHDFTGGSDGSSPQSNVVFDSAGNLYGTATYGATTNQVCGQNGCGVIWEITP